MQRLVGSMSDRLLEAIRRLLETPRVTKDAAAVAPRLRVAGVRSKRLLVRDQRVGMAAEQLQRLPVPEPGLAVSRAERQHGSDVAQRLAMPQEQVEGERAVEEVDGPAGIDLERAVMAGHRPLRGGRGRPAQWRGATTRRRRQGPRPRPDRAPATPRPGGRARGARRRG
jgi:hypothetical protein